MSTVTYTLLTPSAAAAKRAATIIGTPAPRAVPHKDRMIVVMAAALTIIPRAAGNAVDVTELFTELFGTSTPAYNHLHARMGSAAFRTHMIGERSVWSLIKPAALVDYTITGTTITGTPSTTYKGTDCRLLVIGAE